MSVDLRGLPDVVFADSDTSRVETNIIRIAEGILERTLYPADPMRLLLKTLAYVISQQRAVIDYTGKQTLLRYAVKGALEHLGALLGVERLGKARSMTTLRFTLDAPLAYAAAIPAGTRATADGKVIFATDSQVVIPAGQLTGKSTATATVGGTEGNGLVPGQIAMLVDALPFAVKVENTSKTSGGSDEESDEHLRERIRLAPESFSTAGPELAYRFWAMSAHPDIVDVSPLGPPEVDPGCVDVRVLMADGELPSDEVQTMVLASISAEKRRPLTDKVSVNAPEAVEFSGSVQWWIRQEDAALVTSIQQRVDQAVADWREWQTEKIGRDINPSELTRRMVNAGAKRVETELGHVKLTKAQVAVLKGEFTGIYAGVEDH